MISQSSICVERHSRLTSKLLENPRGDGYIPYLSTFLIFIKELAVSPLFMRKTMQSLFLFLSPPNSDSIIINSKCGQI